MHAAMLTQSDAAQRMVLSGGLSVIGSHNEVTLRHLRTPSQIQSVLHLREEIDLSVHAAAASNFADLEKKEMSAASSELLS